MPETTPTNTGTEPGKAPETPALPPNLIHEDGKFYIKTVVDGKDVKVPFDEAQVRLQKETAVETRFERISQREKELETLARQNETKIKYFDLSQKALHQNDRDAARQALELIGLDPDDVVDESQVQNGGNTNTPAEIDWSKAPAPLREAAAFMQRCKESGIDPVDILADAKRRRNEQERNRIYGEAEQAAITNPKLAAVLKENSKRAEWVRNFIRSKVREKIAQQGLPANASTYTQVAREVESELEVLGTLASGGTVPDSSMQDTPMGFLSMGRSSGGVGNTSGVTPASRPKPTTVQEAGQDGYAKNLADRWLYDLATMGT